MTDGNKLFVCNIETIWSCGDQSGDNSWILGVFDDPNKAREVGMNYLEANYHWDEKCCVWYGDAYADEAWVCIRLFNLNVEKDETADDVCLNTADGKWYAGGEVVYG